MMRLISCFTILAMTSGILTGCGAKQPELETIHDQSLDHWLQELKHPALKSRIAAIKSLQTAAMNEPAAVPAIAGALTDEEAKVRDAAALALLNIGPPAKSAVDALIKAKADNNATVRQHAAAALAHIQSGT